MAIDTCVENSGAVIKALAVSTPKCRPRDDPWPRIPAITQNEIPLKYRLRKDVACHQGPRFKSSGQPTAEVGKPQANTVQERSVECYSGIPPFRKKIAVEYDQRRGEISYSITPLVI
jgi:hypothetical protein